jgi:hypothetical protein
MAVAEVDRAVTLGGPCFALLSLAEAHSALRNPRGVLETIRRVPKTCFRSPLLAVWRFRIWDLRARASFDLGRVSEGLRYAGRLVAWMERDDPRELAWAPPHQTVDALQRLAAGDGPAATRARAVLAEIAGRIDLEDWFGPRGADRILTIVAQTAYSQT